MIVFIQLEPNLPPQLDLVMLTRVRSAHGVPALVGTGLLAHGLLKHSTPTVSSTGPTQIVAPSVIPPACPRVLPLVFAANTSLQPAARASLVIGPVLVAIGRARPPRFIRRAHRSRPHLITANAMGARCAKRGKHVTIHALTQMTLIAPVTRQPALIRQGIVVANHDYDCGNAAPTPEKLRAPAPVPGPSPPSLAPTTDSVSSEAESPAPIEAVEKQEGTPLREVRQEDVAKRDVAKKDKKAREAKAREAKAREAKAEAAKRALTARREEAARRKEARRQAAAREEQARQAAEREAAVREEEAMEKARREVAAKEEAAAREQAAGKLVAAKETAERAVRTLARAHDIGSLRRAIEEAEDAHQCGPPEETLSALAAQLPAARRRLQVWQRITQGEAQAREVAEAQATEAKAEAERLQAALLRVDHSLERYDAATRRLESIFTCPITQELMVDPVLTVADGLCYERAAIEQWLVEHDTDPLTGQSLDTKRLVPNVALRSAIREHRALKCATRRDPRVHA